VRYRQSMVNKILLMIVISGILLGAVIITAGAIMIYNAKEDGIISEIHTAGRTLGNLYYAEYDGDLSYDGEVCSAGDKIIGAEDFVRIIGYIDCEDDIDYTLFFEDTRVFTSVQNIDGSYAVGTKAAQDVTQNVLHGGGEYLSSKVLVNGVYYMGYYEPIVRDDGRIMGMLFAGKPLDSATASASDATVRFIVLALVTLFVALGLCFIGARRMLADFSDIKKQLAKLAEGDFTARLPERIMKRRDEIGEVSVHIETVRKNLRDMVERDPLTKLSNRRSCKCYMDNLSISDSEGFSVVMGDIDYFKKINDTYGHAAGDYVLVKISELLERCCHENDGYAARWGGEEFLMVFASHSAQQTAEIVRALLDDIRAAEFSFEGSRIAVTMTFGIADTKCADNAEAVINHADALLYEGKGSGRNRVVTQNDK